MQLTLKLVHLFAVAMWFGSVAFFSFFTALPILGRMKDLATSKGNWLHLSTEADGTRLAGEALNSVFGWYFPVQVACGVVAVLTAFCWVSTPGLAHKLRVGVLVLALLLALANLLIFEPRVHELRQRHYETTPTIPTGQNPEFMRWHSYSLWSDMIGLLLVGVALGLVVALPPPGDRAP